MVLYSYCLYSYGMLPDGSRSDVGVMAWFVESQSHNYIGLYSYGRRSHGWIRRIPKLPIHNPSACGIDMWNRHEHRRVCNDTRTDMCFDACASACAHKKACAVAGQPVSNPSPSPRKHSPRASPY